MLVETPPTAVPRPNNSSPTLTVTTAPSAAHTLDALVSMPRGRLEAPTLQMANSLAIPVILVPKKHSAL